LEKRVRLALSGFAVSLVGTRALISSGKRQNTLQLWDIHTERRLFTLDLHGETVTGVALSRDPRRAAVVVSRGALLAWDIGAENPTQLFDVPTSTVRVRGRSLFFSGLGETLVSSSEEEIRIHDASSGETLNSAATRAESIRSVAINDEGSRLCWIQDDVVYVSDIRMQGKSALHRDARMGAACFIPHSEFILVSTVDGYLLLIHETGGQPYHETRLEIRRDFLVEDLVPDPAGVRCAILDSYGECQVLALDWIFE